MRVKKMASPPEEASIEPAPWVTRLTVDDDFLLITFGPSQEGDFSHEYQIHEPSDYELLKMIVQQPLIKKLWVLELNQKSCNGVVKLSEIESIERCQSFQVPPQMTIIFTVKGQDRYIQYEGPLKDTCLDSVYTLAKFS